MAIFAYEPLLRMSFSDDPSFPDEENAQTVAGSNGDPLNIEEWQTYFVKFYGDPAPSPLKQAKFVVREIQPCLWELNFRNFVGLSRIGALKLIVHNRKISNNLYCTMLDELAESYAALVFDFGSPVGQHYNKSGVGKDCAFVEYLFLRKFLLCDSPNLDAIGDILVYDPHRKFEKELRPCSIEECQAAGITIIHALVNSPMARLRDGHPLQQTHLGKILKDRTSLHLYPAKAAKEIKYLTVDTHENRFIKFFLRELLAKVESLNEALVDKAGSYFNPDINENLESLRKKISQFLSHNMWREVGEMRFIPVSSQVLQRKEGYRQLFRLYSLLQLATHCDFLETDFKNLVETKDVPTIYEYWCFFQIKAVLDALHLRIRKVSRITNESLLNPELTPGLCVDYDCGSQLFFNESYGGSTGINNISETSSYAPNGDSYSHTLRPDIVIVRNGKKLIFDAKYKGKRSGFYGEGDDGTIQRWNEEDIDKMHTYREAIQGVTGSFILYPGTQDILFPRRAGSSLIEGVGALALRPGSIAGKDATDISNIKRTIETFLQSV
ncbi:MAG: DUF2357 domain-containing protein [Deltaproteobacteria bacterium]|nr:DUF2357 domain-containing protein [Deltaproteobacteria bacterium]